MYILIFVHDHFVFIFNYFHLSLKATLGIIICYSGRFMVRWRGEWIPNFWVIVRGEHFEMFLFLTATRHSHYLIKLISFFTIGYVSVFRNLFFFFSPPQKSGSIFFRNIAFSSTGNVFHAFFLHTNCCLFFMSLKINIEKYKAWVYASTYSLFLSNLCHAVLINV